MAIKVEFAGDCLEDLGTPSSDDLAIIFECLRWIRELFENFGGEPPGAHRIPATKHGDWSWRDQHWRIVYGIETRRRFLRPPQVVVRVGRVELKMES